MAKTVQALMGQRPLESSKSIRGVKIVEWSQTSCAQLIEEAIDLYYTKNFLVEGQCIVCNRKTSKFCSKCGTHYCSLECQRNNWSEHISTCLGSSFTPHFNSRKCKKSDGSNTKQYEDVNKKFQRYEKDDEEVSLDSHSVSEYESHEDVNQIPSKTERGGKIKKIPQERFPRESKKKSSENKNKYNKSEPIKCGKFTEGQKIRVKCTFRSQNWFWGIEEPDLKKFHEIQNMLSKNCRSFPVIEDPANKLFCSVYNGEWYRCQVIQETDNFLLRVCDTGAVYRPKIPRFRELPPAIRDIDPLAFQFVCIDSDFPEVDGDFFCARVIGKKSNGVYKLKICDDKKKMNLQKTTKVCEEEKVFGNEKTTKVREEEKVLGNEKTTKVREEEKVLGNEENHTDNKKKHRQPRKPRSKNKNKTLMANHLNKSRRSVMDELRVGSKGSFILAKFGNKELFGCIIPEDLEAANNTYEKINKLYPVDAEITDAQVGEEVLIFLEDYSGHRGIVESRSEDHYQVWLMDFGYSVRVHQAYKLSKDLADLMDLACGVTQLVYKHDDEIELHTPLLFHVVNRNAKGKLMCEFVMNEESEEVVLSGILEKLWIEQDEKPNELKYVEFEDECKVTIVDVGKYNTISVKRVGDKSDDKIRDLSLNSNQINNLTDVDIESLEKDDLVLAKFYENGLWYRAMIISDDISEYKPCEIVFVDFGNKQKSLPSEFKELPDELKEEPIFVRQFILKGSNDKFSSEGRLYLEKFKRQNRPFLLKFIPDMINNVLLTDYDGNEINSLAYKNCWVENIPEVVKDKFLNVSTFREGVVDNFLLLYVNENDFIEKGRFWATDGGSKRFKYVIGELANSITEHCESNREEYVPKIGELCLAQYQGDWYRGLCTFVFGNLAEILYIDFGNRDIACQYTMRKMVPQFMHIPAVASQCVLHDFDKRSKDELREIYSNTSSLVHIHIRGTVVIKKIQDYINYVDFSTVLSSA